MHHFQIANRALSSHQMTIPGNVKALGSHSGAHRLKVQKFKSKFGQLENLVKQMLNAVKVKVRDTSPNTAPKLITLCILLNIDEYTRTNALALLLLEI